VRRRAAAAAPCSRVSSVFAWMRRAPAKLPPRMKAINLIGRVFGRLKVIARAGRTNSKPPRRLWRCRCSCGRERIVLGAYLLAGRTRSCGCLRAERARASIPAARAQRRGRRSELDVARQAPGVLLLGGLANGSRRNPLDPRSLRENKEPPAPVTSCNDLEDFVEGALGPKRAAAFRYHLRTCDICSAGLVEAMQLRARLTTLQRDKPA